MRSFQTMMGALGLLVMTSFAGAGAIDVPQQDARASGQAEAFAAQADDPAAIYSNPAGLTQLRGTNGSGGATLFLPDWEFHGTTGQEQGMHLMSVMPHGYVESDFGLEKWRFGFGMNNVFGLNEDWGSNGTLRTLVDRNHLFVINLAPTVAYQINDHLSIGAAINVYYGDLGLDYMAVLAPPPVPQGHFHFHGEDFALGVTPGILWKIDDRNTIAAVYRSPFKMGFAGQADVKTQGIPDIGPNHTDVDINFPQSATLGYAFRPVKPLKLEADVVWTDWDVVQNISSSSVNPAFKKKIPSNWMSGFQYRFGAQYDLNQHWALRTGYAFGQRAIPSATFSPLVPDSNYHLFSAGVGYSHDNWTIDAAYQFIYRETRHISDSIYGPLVNGTWNNNFNEFMLTFNVKL